VGENKRKGTGRKTAKIRQQGDLKLRTISRLLGGGWEKGGGHK